MSKIEWTTETWNPMVGCSKVSAGCQNCYAINHAHRLAGNPNTKISGVYDGLTERRGDRTEWTGKVNFVPERLELPLKTRKPTTWFVNSMSDLFHESVTDEQLDQIFAVMALTPHHTYQVLTKRPQRMLEYCTDRFRSRKILEAAQRLGVKGLIDPGMVIPIYPYGHVWLGVTVENQKAADDRIPLLLETPAAVRFLSCEPLLESIDLSGFAPFCWERIDPEMTRQLFEMFGGPLPEDSLNDIEGNKRIDWVIVGGESGHGSRPCDVTWIHSIVNQCAAAEVPCFVKQLGANVRSLPVDYGNFGRGKGKMNILEQWPPYLRVRQMPGVAVPA